MVLLSEALALELAPTCVQVSTIQPGVFRTDFAASAHIVPPTETYEPTVGRFLSELAAEALGDPALESDCRRHAVWHLLRSPQKERGDMANGNRVEQINAIESLANKSYDVVIIGCGPTGLTLARLLATKGVTLAVIDPNRIVCQHPRATHIDDETMRTLQTIGVRDLERKFLRMDGMSLCGHDGVPFLEFAMPSVRSDQGWHSDYQFHQPDFESRLRGLLATEKDVNLWLGWQLAALEQYMESVRLTVSERVTGRELQLWASFVVGADGAGSLVRRLMDPQVEDLNATQRSLIVDIHPFERPTSLHPTRGFIRCDADRPITYVPLQPPMLRFEFMLRPADEAQVLERPDHVYWLLSAWLSPGSYRVMRTDTYEWHAHLVHGWRQGRLLLAGDAAHTMPPMLGQGMCSGLRDAVNLAWKLTAVVQGRSAENLLDTYESERAVHVRPFIIESARQANMVENYGLAFELPQAGEPQQLVGFRPRLGPGVVDIENAASGYLAPQPQADDGALFDDIVGYNFAVFTTPEMVGSVDDETRKMWMDLDARLMTVHSSERDGWLADHGGDALIVRPDRYTFAITKGAEELRAASLSLHDRLLEPGIGS